MPRLPDSIGILRQREYRLLFLGQSVSLFGDGMVRVALPFAVLSVERSAAAVGIVLAARVLPMVAFLLVGGVVADRLSRRTVMIAADLVRLGSQAAMAALLIAGVAEVWSLAVLAGVGGAATGFFNPASTGVLPAVVSAADFQRANGLRATVGAGGEIAGPAVAGILVATVGAGWAIAVDAATFALSALFLSRMRPIARTAQAGATFLSDLRAGWGTFVSLRWVWTVVLAASLGNMFWGAWATLGPVVAERDLGGATAWGLVLAATGVGGLVGGIAAIRYDPERPGIVTALSWLVFGIPIAALAAGAPVEVVAAAALISGVGLMAGNTLWESTLQRHVPPESLSRVSAYDWFGSLAFHPLGLAIWGPIAAVVGVAEALWISFGLQLAVSLAMLAVPEVRGLRREPAAISAR